MKPAHQLLLFALALAACSPPAPASDTPFTLKPALGSGAADPCIPDGQTRDSLAALKAAEFAVADDAARQALALALSRCLSSADPLLRDGMAFEALSKWMRADLLTEATRHTLMDDLLARLRSTQPAGFEAPFAALALSEVARTDRIKQWLDDNERSRLIAAAADFETHITDYRGFDANEGWRHSVAHGADLLLQLALNPRVGEQGQAFIRDAVASQVAPAGHAYVFGEPERLARPILALASRNTLTTQQWSQWLASVTGPGPAGSWEGAFQDEALLARRHNVTAFLEALYVNVTLGSDRSADVLRPGIETALRALP
jgi:hypothetical protein